MPIRWSVLQHKLHNIKPEEFFHSEVQINVIHRIKFGKKFQQFNLVDLFGQFRYIQRGIFFVCPQSVEFLLFNEYNVQQNNSLLKYICTDAMSYLCRAIRNFSNLFFALLDVLLFFSLKNENIRR